MDIKKLNFILILLVWTLLTVSTAASRPEGMIMKGGVLTYPAGSYHEKEPLSLYFNTYGCNQAHTLSNSPMYIEPTKDLSQYNGEEQTDLSENYGVEDSWKWLSSLLFLLSLSKTQNLLL